MKWNLYVLKSTSLKKTTIQTPFLGGSAILEIVFLALTGTLVNIGANGPDGVTQIFFKTM